MLSKIMILARAEDMVRSGGYLWGANWRQYQPNNGGRTRPPIRGPWTYKTQGGVGTKMSSFAFSSPIMCRNWLVHSENVQFWKYEVRKYLVLSAKTIMISWFFSLLLRCKVRSARWKVICLFLLGCKVRIEKFAVWSLSFKKKYSLHSNPYHRAVSCVSLFFFYSPWHKTLEVSHSRSLKNRVKQKIEK